MDMTFTTEFPWDEEELAQVESWCHHHLRGPYRLLWYNWSTIELHMAAIEDHALVELTWA